MKRSLTRARIAIGAALFAGTFVAGAWHFEGARAAVGAGLVLLPNNWRIEQPRGATGRTGTMPQGAALAPDGKRIAVVESGFNPPALSLYALPSLQRIRRYALSGAFGKPVWTGSQILVAGANADAVFAIDTKTGRVAKIKLPAKTYPVSIAFRNGVVAVASDIDGSVRIGRLSQLGATKPVRIGRNPGGLAFSNDGQYVFAAIRASSDVAVVSVRSRGVKRIRTGLHPADVLVRGHELFVAEADADSVEVFNTNNLQRLAKVYVGTSRGIGASPNALAAQGNSVYVSLGAANQLAVIRGYRVVGRIPTGWYPTGVVPASGRLYVVNGKGEEMQPNPLFDFRSTSNLGYIAATENGSLRALPATGLFHGDTGPVPYKTPAHTIVHKGGPIEHVFFILKENRTYDQVLGDMPRGNGDPDLVSFGRLVTPNQHAIAERFGLFDNTYASGEVSDAGHNWADGAFANDYVERFWPLTYGGRRDTDDNVTGTGAAVPARGYIWDAAKRAGVSFRDYGEMGTVAPAKPGPTAPSLAGRFDPHYIGWDLNYSDLDRVKEWRREFGAFLSNGTLPQFEFLWLPNDHTSGSRAGKLTPEAYVAQNDYAVGQIVDAISHSRVWRPSAIFVIEDDAQDGPDHVSAQRTTFYLASPYASGGVRHEHYSTVSVLHTIELMLGIAPLSTYDATAMPLYAAFGAVPHIAPFVALAPRVDLEARNKKTAELPGSERADYSRPDGAGALSYAP